MNEKWVRETAAHFLAGMESARNDPAVHADAERVAAALWDSLMDQSPRAKFFRAIRRLRRRFLS